MMREEQKKTVIIIGAGPAGLTAAFELAAHSDMKPIVIEKLDIVGGLSRTVNYKGNRIDIGGHRFFSKSDKVLDWWLNLLPLEASNGKDLKISYHNKTKEVSNKHRSVTYNAEDVMLVRQRKSRIYFLNRLFPYPITLSIATLRKLGLSRSIKILVSYSKFHLFPIENEESLEDFMINRFGKELYYTFFKDYTQKVWGVAPKNISAEWGRQRIKGISIKKILVNALKIKRNGDILQKNTETSLIERFLYPKYGPGHLWEKAADIIKENGGQILMNQSVCAMDVDGDQIKKVIVKDKNGTETHLSGEYFISTMPLKELISALNSNSIPEVKRVAEGLEYRDFISVGLLVKDLKLKDHKGHLIKDNWIYIQEKGVQMGRLQIFNNWSPYLVNRKDTVWLGLEYFCTESDALWNMKDEDLLRLAEEELIKMNIIDHGVVLDGTIVRAEKAYPSYHGTYGEMNLVRNHLEKYKNLFLIGRNGMHRYNNQDHSMLTAMEAVKKIREGDVDKSSIWAINTEETYQEIK